MVWYPFLGWSTFWIGLVVSIILFSIYRKIYPVFYLASVCLYIFTAGFVIDVFDLSRGFILSILIFSSLLFMGLGYYLSKVFESKK